MIFQTIFFSKYNNKSNFSPSGNTTVIFQLSEICLRCYNTINTPTIIKLKNLRLYMVVKKNLLNKLKIIIFFLIFMLILMENVINELHIQ